VIGSRARRRFEARDRKRNGVEPPFMKAAPSRRTAKVGGRDGTDMDFEIRHTFDADRDTVEAAMFDADLPGFLIKNMSLVTGIEVVERKDESWGVSRKVRYTPVPMIKKVGTKEVKPEWMAWIEQSRFDRSAHRLEFENLPTIRQIRELMEQRGTIRFESDGVGRTQRTISGVLKIKVFLIGKIAERIIYSNAEKILDEEARAFNAYLRQRKA
jgi:hypothetical protein